MTRRARGTLAVLRALPGQRRLPYLPRERIRELRDHRVRETVGAAAAHVPHYREHFRRAGIDPREIRTADDLTALPVLGKEAVSRTLDAFRSEAFAPGEVTALWTSGTTGAWLEVRHDNASLLAGIAYAERDRAVEGHFCGRRYRYTAVEIRSDDSSVGHAQRVYRRTSWRPLRPGTHVVPLETAPDRIVATLNALRPDSVRTYGSYAEPLFRVVAAEQLALALPRVLVYGGDAMSPAGRAFVEERFGVPVISRYGAVEAPRIGFMCEQRSGFHLNEDLGHVRLLDPSGRDVPAGEPGEVVVSNLVNRATVLINYRLGDYARFVDEPCACGRTLRRLGDLEGRVAEVLRLDGGTLVHQYTLWHALVPIDGLLNFQLVQRDARRFELRLQTAPSRYEQVARAAGEEVRRLLPGCRVEPVPAERLGAAPQRGKFRRIVPLAGGHGT